MKHLERFNVRSAALFAALLLALPLTGCKGVRPYNVVIETDSSFNGQRVLVDLVGVNASQRSQLEMKSVTEYWGDADPLRASSIKHTMQFSKGGEKQTLPDDDELWTRWIKERGVSDLFVIADLPGMGKPQDAPGNADPRRRILPLNSKFWVKTDELKVIVTRGGLQVVTGQKPQ
ncbi:MAG TPA: hypothetical protein DCY13_17775 [Verrucomicrobiales bacterium]|nr:hypothetical protein [Verrucomicrobiales bacterium]